LLLIVGVLPFAGPGTDRRRRHGGSGLLYLVGEASPHVLLASLFVLTAAIGLFIPNTATAVLMAPIALSTAGHLGASPPRCNDRRASLLGGVHDADIVTSQHTGTRTGSITGSVIL
jgi:hypothetical protein